MNRADIQKQIPEIRKQVSVFVPLSDWRLLRDEAIRRRKPMAELCRGWMEPELNRIRRRCQAGTPAPADSR